MTTHRPVGPATPQETVASPAPETPPETAAPLEPETPSWRSLRGWVIAALQTLLCLGLGCLMFLVVLGELLFEFD
ncbi:MAG TPA: hypothetical protein K8W24_01915, partial [Brachybacterium paraconglomeratum]|nr:hypothetical protein [Brachybacterium paraconglomeratum]